MRRLKRTFVKASTGVRLGLGPRAEGTAESLCETEMEMGTRLSCWYNLMRQAAITTTTNEDSQVAVVVVGQSSTTATTTTTMDSNS